MAINSIKEQGRLPFVERRRKKEGEEKEHAKVEAGSPHIYRYLVGKFFSHRGNSIPDLPSELGGSTMVQSRVSPGPSGIEGET